MSWISTADGTARDLLRSGAETDPARAAERGEAMERRFREAVSILIRDGDRIERWTDDRARFAVFAAGG